MSDIVNALVVSDIIEANNKVYARELELASTLAEQLPISFIAQDLRSKNRFREHSQEGCSLINLGNTSHRQPNHQLFRCACGWIGWLIPKENHE